MNITRRNFLKSVGVLAAGSLLVLDFRILLPGEMPAIDETRLFKLRKFCYFDIRTEVCIVRYDVRYDVRYWNRKKVATQYHVSVELSNPEKMKRQEFIERYHRPMELVLKNQILHDKVLYKNLMPLGYPHGYHEPEWFTKLIKGG